MSSVKRNLLLTANVWIFCVWLHPILCEIGIDLIQLCANDLSKCLGGKIGAKRIFKTIADSAKTVYPDKAKYHSQKFEVAY